MTDEFDCIREYVDSRPPVGPGGLEIARAHLGEAMAQEVAARRQAFGKPDKVTWRSSVPSSGRRARSLVLVGSAAVLIAVVTVPLLMGGTAKSGHLASRSKIPSTLLVKLLADDANVTVASGSYDMTYDDTTTAPTSCPENGGGTPQTLGASGTPVLDCQNDNAFSDISGYGTVDTDPYAMMTVGQVGPLGTVTLYDDGTNVWEIGGGDYGLAGPGQAGPGAPLSGFATSVEGTLGREAGALSMQGLASGTGYLDLEAAEIQGALPAGTGTVDGVPVTIYKLSQTGLQDPDLNGLTTEQVATIRAADAIVEQSGFAGKTTWVSVDADGYIREQRTVYTLSDGSTVTQDTILSNFGCAGTVVMPGQTGSTGPAPGCVSPDKAGSGHAPSTPPTALSKAPSTTLITTPTTPAPAAPACQNGQIAVTPSPGGAAAGNVSQLILFRNVSDVACTLTGYPGVAALGAAGAQLEQAKRELKGMLGGLQNNTTTPPAVALEPGGLASAAVEGGDEPGPGATSCPWYPSFLVTPPGLTQSVTIPVGLPGSSIPGFPGCGPIRIDPVVPGGNGRVD